MDYPKYIEFSNHRVLLFPATLSHREIAARVDEPPVSAGFACFPTNDRRHVSFFGRSITLGLPATTQPHPIEATWFGGKFASHYGLPAIGNDPKLLESIGIQPSELALVSLKDDCDNQIIVPYVPNIALSDLVQFCGYFSAPWTVQKN